MSASQPAAKVSYQPPTPISELCTFIERHLCSHTSLTTADYLISREALRGRVRIASTPDYTEISQPPLTSAVKVLVSYVGGARVAEAFGGALLTSAGAPHVGQAPQAVRVAVTIAPEHALIGSRDHGPRERTDVLCVARRAAE
ncbi:unnamed protein product [Arctia plantaginis]|uniref:Uncharacterized protein n=1 Tax=Arctia plantaginis TaxID=874455 RepID=A0A8S0YTF3_ARCPL|nr:unnamed protein product [Arctia plantaginis]CAB3237906.1 unnamed protein product [Arctia plantaginis]